MTMTISGLCCCCGLHVRRKKKVEPETSISAAPTDTNPFGSNLETFRVWSPNLGSIAFRNRARVAPKCVRIPEVPEITTNNSNRTSISKNSILGANAESGKNHGTTVGAGSINDSGHQSRNYKIPSPAANQSHTEKGERVRKETGGEICKERKENKEQQNKERDRRTVDKESVSGERKNENNVDSKDRNITYTIRKMEKEENVMKRKETRCNENVKQDRTETIRNNDSFKVNKDGKGTYLEKEKVCHHREEKHNETSKEDIIERKKEVVNCPTGDNTDISTSSLGATLAAASPDDRKGRQCSKRTKHKIKCYNNEAFEKTEADHNERILILQIEGRSSSFA